MAYTVLLVEDEQLVREDLASSTPWGDLGLKLVGTCRDGVEGEAMIRSLCPDIVVTDIRMPGKDGLEMLRSCQAPHAIILSGYTDFGYTRQAIRLGVWDYLEKPVDSAEFEDALRGLVEKIRTEEEEAGRLAKGPDTSSEMISLPRSVGNHMVDSVITFVSDNYMRPVGLQEAADHVGLSESHLSRLFKEETGINFLQYLNAWRINKAAAMLPDPKLSVNEVASACGFPTPGYFAKIFKRFLGQTPTQFRDSLGTNL